MSGEDLKGEVLRSLVGWGVKKAGVSFLALRKASV